MVIRVKDIDEEINIWRDYPGLTLERTAESEALGIKLGVHRSKFRKWHVDSAIRQILKEVL